jgi:hypothetical protein
MMDNSSLGMMTYIPKIWKVLESHKIPWFQSPPTSSFQFLPENIVVSNLKCDGNPWLYWHPFLHGITGITMDNPCWGLANWGYESDAKWDDPACTG